MSTTAISPTAPSLVGTSNSTPTSSATSAQEQQDRFLKLLVAQLSNQDPLHPLDNAEMTTQIAQINTVGGIDKVNETLKGIAEQFNAMQVLQGSSMVGHNVLVQSNQLTLDGAKANGAIELSGTADAVKVEILTSGGQLLDTLNLGAKTEGRHEFSWDASKYKGSDPKFRVTATNGNTAVATTALAQDKVISVGSVNGQLSLQLQGRGAVAYSTVKAIL